jgi:hypothetical protein
MDKFKLEEPTLTDKHEDFVKQYYDLELTELSEADQELLINFIDHGASETIMNRIVQLQEEI